MDLPRDPVAAHEILITNDERTSLESKPEHPLSQVEVDQGEKLTDLSLDGVSSGVTTERAVTHHTAEGAQAKATVPLIMKEERELEGEGDLFF